MQYSLLRPQNPFARKKIRNFLTFFLFLALIPFVGKSQTGPCTSPDTAAPLILGVPADDTLSCPAPLPTFNVSVDDNCPGAFIFQSQFVVSNECSPGLQAWFPAEGNANDANGLFTGSLVNGTAFGAGIAGQAFSFDGVNDYVEITNPVNFAQGNYSVVLWFQTSANTQQSLFSAVDPITGQPGIRLSLTPDGIPEFIHRAPPGPSGPTLLTSIPDTLNDGQFHQIAAIRTDTILRLYIDANLVATAVDTDTFATPLRVVLGQNSFINFGNNDNFAGLIDENRVYSRSLCSQEVITLYQSGLQGVYGPQFTLTTVWDAFDASGNFSQAVHVTTYLDDTPPVLTPPAPTSLECNGPNGILMANRLIMDWLHSATASDECSCVNLTFNAPPIFPSDCGVGHTTTIVFAATDGCGNITTDSSTITVYDSTSPDLTCPADITVSPDVATCSKAVSYQATVTDNCDSPTPTYSHAPGSLFPEGTTTVTVNVADNCGNQTTACTFDVTVESNLRVAPCRASQYVAYGYPPEASAQITLDVTGGIAPYTYLWSTGETTSEIIVSPSMTTVYSVTVTDAIGCEWTARHTVNVIDMTCGNPQSGSMGSGSGSGPHIILCKENKSGSPENKCVKLKSAAKKLAKSNYSLGPCGTNVDFSGGACGEPPYESCDCFGPLRSATFSFQGSGPVNIRITADRQGAQFIGDWRNVRSGNLITIDGTHLAGGVLPKNVYVSVDGMKPQKLNTECSGSKVKIKSSSGSSKSGSSKSGSSKSGSSKSKSSGSGSDMGWKLLGWTDNSGAVCDLFAMHNKSGDVSSNRPEDLQFSIAPNPFHHSATLYLRMEESQKVQIEMYNLTGVKIMQVFEGEVEGQELQSIDFNASGLSSGVYFLKLRTETGGFRTLKVILEQ